MKFEHYLNRLRESPEYKKFRGKYRNEYLCAGFFILDFETGKDMHQIDYALPNGKIATFILDDEVSYKISEQPLKKKLPEIKRDIKTDLEALKGIVEDEMKNRTVTEKIRKMIVVLHNMDGKLIWNLQCILSGLEILLVHVDDSDQSILKFEKHSLMELLKPGSGSMIQLTPKQTAGMPKVQKVSPEQLEKLEKLIKAAKEKAQKEQKQPKKKK